MTEPVAPLSTEALARRNKKMGIGLGVFAVGMVAFTAFLWVVGGIICDWAGIGISPNKQPPAIQQGIEQ